MNTKNTVNKKIKRIVSIILAVIGIFQFSVFAEDEKNVEYTYLDKLFGYASELYIDDTITKEEILRRAVENFLKDNPEGLVQLLKAGFDGLDDYCDYYAGSEYQEYVDNINHTFYGIGVVIKGDGDYITINQILDGGSAKAVGLAVGDKITAVNGEDMHGKTVDYVQSKVVGELNTEVSITVDRNGERITYTLTRQPVNATTVGSIVLDDKTAYVSMTNFAMSTANEFSAILDELDEKGISQIILDLRDNPGGYLDSAVQIAKLVVPEGIIVQTMFRQEENNVTYYSDLKNPKFKFAVLVNENTASSAEILTGAMQDSGIAKVFGTTTYGKAVIQDVFNMRNGDSFKITTGRYLTRNGREINKKGIDPDEEVPNTTEPIDVTKYKALNCSEEAFIGDSSENISVVKERLALLGYAINNTDNVFDNDLEALTLDFQISNGLEPTGRLDRITLTQIENAFAKVETLVDNQLYKAYEYFGGSREQLDKVLDGNEE